MSQIKNVANINYSTAFATDKICGVLSNTFTASTFNTGSPAYLYQYTLPHNLTRPSFMDGIFSLNNSTFVPNGQSDGTNSYFVYSDSSNYYILTTANSGLVYYKIVSTWVDNYDATNPLITPVFNATLPSVNNTTYFDSRSNYQKILTSNVVTLNNPGAGNTGTYTVAHNLGYTPNFKIHFESLPNQVWPTINGGTKDLWLYDPAHQYEVYGVVDNTNLTITYSGGSTSASTFRTWYRIYYDK